MQEEDQLPADDDAKGIEMEADFDGALGDIPPGQADESDEDAPQVICLFWPTGN